MLTTIGADTVTGVTRRREGVQYRDFLREPVHRLPMLLHLISSCIFLVHSLYSHGDATFAANIEM